MKIIKYFQGLFFYFSWTIQFKYKEMHFLIIRMSTGRGQYGGGSLPILQAFVESPSAFMIGNALSEKYCLLGEKPTFHQILFLSKTLQSFPSLGFILD